GEPAVLDAGSGIDRAIAHARVHPFVRVYRWRVPDPVLGPGAAARRRPARMHLHPPGRVTQGVRGTTGGRPGRRARPGTVSTSVERFARIQTRRTGYRGCGWRRGPYPWLGPGAAPGRRDVTCAGRWNDGGQADPE